MPTRKRQARSIVPLVQAQKYWYSTSCAMPTPDSNDSVFLSPAVASNPELSSACAGPPPGSPRSLDTEPELHGVSDQVRSETMHARRKPRDKKIVAAVAPRAAPAVVGRRGQEPNVLLTLAARDGRHRAFGADPLLAARDGRHRAFGADPLSPAQARFP